MLQENIDISSLSAVNNDFNAKKVFDAHVSWLKDFIQERNVPGLLVGLSGTDSILSFILCAEAMKQLGRPEHAVGIHYGAAFPPEGKTQKQIDRILELNPNYRWEAREIIPWLQERYPNSRVLVESGIDYTDDYQRWAALFKYSLGGALKTESLPAGKNFWVVGTRNATEECLYTYSNISSCVSLMPILNLWKGDVLKICKMLNVPEVAMKHSRQADCDCGRFDLAANHIEEIDEILKARKAGRPLQINIPDKLFAELTAFIDEQVSYASFKAEIPYRPEYATVF